MKSSVEELLRRKGHEVISIDAGATVFEAIEVMEARRVGSIIATDNGKTVGIFTERDYLRRIVLQGRTSKSTLVREAMTSTLVSVEPDSSIEDCMALMTEHRIRHLPVIADNKLIGVLSIGDLVKHLLAETRAKADHLQNLISGSYPG